MTSLCISNEKRFCLKQKVMTGIIPILVINELGGIWANKADADYCLWPLTKRKWRNSLLER